jgi:branched-chain amino acid transport system ATP-binding protein
MILQAKNITKAFYGNKAVDDVSFVAKKGEITSIIGANGAGKTTLFNCLTGYYRADSGEILFNGTRIEKLPPHRICRMGIARTFQIAKPFGELSVLENIIVSSYNHIKTKAKVIEHAKYCASLVNLTNKLDVNAALLNAGEQRRLELARALSTKPELLLLDEVMAGLTPSESIEMVKIIRKIRDSGISVIMIEHVMQVIMSLSDNIFVLDTGKLIASGTPTEIANNELVINSYLGKKYTATEDTNNA